jgi:hypothetical protein
VHLPDYHALRRAAKTAGKSARTVVLSMCAMAAYAVTSSGSTASGPSNRVEFATGLLA